MQATAPVSLTVSLQNPAFTPVKIDLPIVRIDTGGAAVVSKTTSVPGTITITSADGSKSYLPNASDTDSTANFHVHGNSTALMPKLPYTVKLNTSLDLLGQMGLVCPYVTGSGLPVCDKSKTYLLLANYDDKTMLRDWAASALANAIPFGGDFLSPTPVPSPYTGSIPSPSGTKVPLPWAPHSLFVELYLNGAYQGTYQLIESVRVDSHRINIASLSQSQVSGDISGGYLLEVDQHEDETFVFKTPQTLSVGLIDPDFAPSPDVPEQTAYISNYVDTAENALFSSSFQDPTTGWRAYFDQASAVNYFLVNDLMGNVDGGDFYSSVFFYKSADNPFLYMGAVWDFDISSGNVNFAPIVDPTIAWTATQGPWYAQWFKDPAFKSAVQQQWNALKKDGVLSSWVAGVSNQAAVLQQAQANNFGRWPMQGIAVWPNAEAVGSYTGEVNYLLNWIALRTGYLDSFLNGTPRTTTTLTSSLASVYAGATVKLTAKVTGASPTGAVTFNYNSIVLGQAAIDGTGTATLTTASMPVGVWQLGATYNGDTNNALSAAATTPLTVLGPLAQTSMNLSSSISSPSYGSPVTFTGAVVATSGSTLPTGSVTFLANNTSIGSVALSSTGVASLTTSSLPGGQVTVQAQYAGDTINATSVSNPLLETVATDFSLAAQGSTMLTLAQNTTSSFTFALTPIGGSYPGDVALTVTGVPADVSYTLTPTAVSAASGAQQITLTFSYNGTKASRHVPPGETFLVCGLLCLPFSLLRRRGIRAATSNLLFVFAMGCVLLGVVGCGTGQQKPFNSYNITLSGSAGSLQHTSVVTLQAQ